MHLHAGSVSVLFASLLAGAALSGCDATSAPPPPPSPAAVVADDLEAADNPAIIRFLSHATFGATAAEITKVRNQGYGAWLKAQLRAPYTRHLPYVESVFPPVNLGRPQANPIPLTDSMWTKMILADDQVRQRLAFAFSEIMVVSTNDNQLARRPAGVAHYFDILGANATGNFRALLEGVSRNPMMGMYLSSIKNQKFDAATGRAPDENYAREVMQLFTIGLHELELDGTLKLGANNKPIETYGDNDIVGLARVFTGYSWACVNRDTAKTCFTGASGTEERRDVLPMQQYPQYHSPEDAKFLDVTLPGSWTPQRRMEAALDRLATHPNVAPFISKQLIKRLVTSNPSPNYVRRVVSAFRQGTYVYDKETPAVTFGDGHGGNLEAAVAAILLDGEANAANQTEKLDEPILRFTRWARAFGAVPTGGDKPGIIHMADIGERDELAQYPLRSPSVFNFFRPGYTPPGAIAAANKVAPEFQGIDEVTVAGYANFMRRAIVNLPMRGGGDFSTDYATLTPLANNPTALVARVDMLLTGQRMSAATKTTIIDAVQTVPFPASPPATAAQVDAARLNRSRLAVYLGTISTDFLVH